VSNSSFNQLSIEQPTNTTANIPLPIYHLEIVDCSQVKEIIISRPISLMKIKNSSPGLILTGKQFVKELLEKS
jgi:hypothetical protein